MESLPLASCPKHIPDGVGDCPLGGSGPAAFRAYSLPWLGQVFLEFPPQWPRHPEVVHFRRCGSLSHKAHLLSRMVMVAIPFSERCVFVQGSQGSSRIESKLDFSHLSQSGWVAHRPSAQREAISRWLHTPLFAISATKPQAELRKGLLRGF